LPFEDIFRKLKQFDSDKPNVKMARIIHFDIAFEVWYDVDSFLFQLLIMSVLQSYNGELWRRDMTDLFLIEIMSPRIVSTGKVSKPLHSILSILPELKCLPPQETLELFASLKYNNNLLVPPLLFDQITHQSEAIQRSCQYLYELEYNSNKLEKFVFDYTNKAKFKNPTTCLELLLKHCKSQEPNWLTLHNFARFLNLQLIDCETCVFFNDEMFAGFKTFVIKFMVQMSLDFALPSLEISDRSALHFDKDQGATFKLNESQMRKRWEKNPHPYLIFNSDHHTFTFFGFNVNKQSGHLVDPSTGEIIYADLILPRQLIQNIQLQDRNILSENILTLTKTEKIGKLLNVMNIKWHYNEQIVDPDPSYELTMDNLLKMLAIYMRMRADIPIIIMGETGCGKTRLVRYMCDLQKNPKDSRKFNNMYLVKVHGGITSRDIENHLNKAVHLAKLNERNNADLFTVLFFDEANSTEAIGTIKEIMCDSRSNGKLFDKTNLKIIAACNPYKKHTDAMIASFDKSGLGFFFQLK
jgi:hypothetical protein